MEDVGSVTRRKGADQAQNGIHYRTEMGGLFSHQPKRGLLGLVSGPLLPTCKAVASPLTLTHPSEMLRGRSEVSR